MPKIKSAKILLSLNNKKARIIYIAQDLEAKISKNHRRDVTFEPSNTDTSLTLLCQYSFNFICAVKTARCHQIVPEETLIAI